MKSGFIGHFIHSNTSANIESTHIFLPPNLDNILLQIFVHPPAVASPIYPQQGPANPLKHLGNRTGTLLLHNVQLFGRPLALLHQKMQEGHIAKKLK